MELPGSPLIPLPVLETTAHSTEEARAFLQRRLQLLFRTFFALTGTFYAITTLAAVFALGMPWFRALTDPAYGFHLLGAVLAGCLWLLCRTPSPSASALGWMDGAGMLGVLYLLKFDAFADRDSHSLLLATMGALISRAVIVPTTVRRTFWISLLGALPDAILLGLMNRALPLSDALLPTLDALLWGGVTVTMSTLVSRIIYGLRKQVREAHRLGQYTLLQSLGAGAMGEVYLASHALMRRRTAIKLLRANADGHSLERFEREVQLTSQLTHPNTIAIYDYGRTAEGTFYYVMEYLEGVDLEGLLIVDGPQPPGRVIHILRQVCGALEEAHGLGLLHRDIKPANLFLCRRRGVPDMLKVLDFGLVKELGVAEASLTRAHTIAGTPLYLSPEAIVSPQKLGPRSDLYSVGAVGYALLTGTHLFQGASPMEICSHHVHTKPEPPSRRADKELPEDLCALILRCLEKDLEARYANARELRLALDACADAGRWTEEDAERWWVANASRMEARRPSNRTPSALTGTQTLVTELPAPVRAA